ncbi:MAG: lipid-A-disaccharide synthase [Alphaproteobacteria bacterium]|nr:lipid-A-disaccharide synthase [Alphaproteobacteria bacterium]
MKKIFIIAGEASGDILGADLIRAMPGVRFVGVGGVEMEKAGRFRSVFKIRDIAVMGLFEVLSKLPIIWWRKHQTIQAIKRAKPDMLLTIDAPGFNIRIAKAAKKLDPKIKCVHYVAPQVWAWKPKRAAKIARTFDALLCFFPFEVPYFTRHGLPTFAVGHTSVDIKSSAKKPSGETVITMLPGSRPAMLKRLLPIYDKTAELLNARTKNLKILMPVVETSEELVAKLTRDWKIKPTLIKGRQARYDAFKKSHAALAISGTAVLELALLGTPTVVAYKLSPISYFIAKRIVNIKSFTLPNIVLKKAVVPEFIQDAATPEKLSHALLKFVNDKKALAKYEGEIKRLKPLVAPADHQRPSQKAAAIIKGLLNG